VPRDIFLIHGILFVLSLNAQQDSGRRAIPYPHLREADVAYQKRVERIMDTREKQNICINWPRNPLSRIVYQNILDETLAAYKDDSLVTKYNPEVSERGSVTENKQVPNPNNPDDIYDLIDTTIITPFDPEKIIKWRLMEDWIFDRKHSTMIVRIIAIAPLFKPVIAGLEFSETPLFGFVGTKPAKKCSPIMRFLTRLIMRP
jgi:hypothetical protein